MVVLAAMSGGVDRAHPAELVASIASAMDPSTFFTTQFYRGCRAPCHGAGNPKIHIKGWRPVDFGQICPLFC
jgi:hypothetical protein